MRRPPFIDVRKFGAPGVGYDVSKPWLQTACLECGPSRNSSKPSTGCPSDINKGITFAQSSASPCFVGPGTTLARGMGGGTAAALARGAVIIDGAVSMTKPRQATRHVLVRRPHPRMTFFQDPYASLKSSCFRVRCHSYPSRSAPSTLSQVEGISEHQRKFGEIVEDVVRPASDDA